jgi:hypothetical protein
MIVSEIGNIPPHSVPVVIKEIVNEDQDDRSNSDDSNSSFSSESSVADEENAFLEMPGEESSGDEHQDLPSNSRAQQMARRKAKLEMEDVYN